MQNTWMSVLDDLDWEEVCSHYKRRRNVHRQLLRYYSDKNVRAFVDLALGINDVHGNYSASEHRLGPKILSLNPNAANRVFMLAENFSLLRTAREVPSLIRKANISNLKIGIGSEISCMINPNVCWVANTRTIWADLVRKHNSFKIANENLQLYRDDDVTSEMAYQNWTALHQGLGASLILIYEETEQPASRANVRPGRIKYLWADAVADALYADYHKD